MTLKLLNKTKAKRYIIGNNNVLQTMKFRAVTVPVSVADKTEEVPALVSIYPDYTLRHLAASRSCISAHHQKYLEPCLDQIHP